MNLNTNFKPIRIVWWIFAPILTAFIINSAILIYLNGKKTFQSDIYDFDTIYIKSFPKFFDYKKIHSPKKNIPKTSKLKDIKLKACYKGKDKEFVIVQDSSKTVFIDIKEEYKGFRLQNIGIDYAVFEKNGKIFKLKIDKIKEDKTQITQTTNFKTNLETDSRYIEITRRDLSKYSKNIKRALRDIRIDVLKSDGEFKGLKIDFVRKGSLFDKMGLKKGDIIKSIDDHQIKSIMDLLPYYNRLNETTTLKIGFERDKQLKEITYEID